MANAKFVALLYFIKKKKKEKRTEYFKATTLTANNHYLSTTVSVFVSDYCKLSFFNAHVLTMCVHTYMNVNKLCLKQLLSFDSEQLLFIKLNLNIKPV